MKVVKSFFKVVGVILLCIVTLGILGSISSETQGRKTGNAEERSLTPQEKRDKIAKDCFSSWSGLPDGMPEAINGELRDPDSFERMATILTSTLNKHGRVGFDVQFRARNGFGGMTTGDAVGEIDEDCKLHGVRVGDL